MVVLVLERVPASLRGELTRWMLEIRCAEFLSETLTTPVRERLWQKACRGVGGGAAILVYSARNEQGFSVILGRSVAFRRGLRGTSPGADSIRDG